MPLLVINLKFLQLLLQKGSRVPKLSPKPTNTWCPPLERKSTLFVRFYSFILPVQLLNPKLLQ